MAVVSPSNHFIRPERIDWMAYLSVYLPFRLPSHTLIVHESSTRLGSPIAKAIELFMGFGGVFSDGGLKGGPVFFQIRAYSGWFL